MKNNIAHILDIEKIFSSVLDNPQDIIKIQSKFPSHNKSKTPTKFPDAIYIPYLNRETHLIEILNLLLWYPGPIFILNSDNNVKNELLKTTNASVLNYNTFAITDKLKELKTFTNSYGYQTIGNWDLPLKRNFAIWHSIQNGFNKILLLDDDIYGFNEQLMHYNIEALDANNISGSLVKEFPDTSVVGHIEQKFGEPYNPFLSGNFLFIKPKEATGYFPLIYNEDWLFMIPSILQKKIIAIDVIYQKNYNPYDDISRIGLQEFGEIIGEGLFELISRNKWEYRTNENFWNDYITYRKDYVTELKKNDDMTSQMLLKESLNISNKITSKNCVDFVLDWESDIITFEKIKNNDK